MRGSFCAFPNNQQITAQLTGLQIFVRFDPTLGNPRVSLNNCFNSVAHWLSKACSKFFNSRIKCAIQSCLAFVGVFNCAAKLSETYTDNGKPSGNVSLMVLYPLL